MLYIILGIVLLICLVLSLKIKLHIIYEDELLVYLKILFIKIKLIPDTNKKFDIGKLTHRKKTSSTAVISDIKKAAPTSPSTLDKLNSVRDILSIIFKSFHRNITVKVTKIHIKVATPDAAQTAILYGAVSTVVACILDLIDDITKLKPLKESSTLVEPDFLSEKTDIKLNILLYVSVFNTIKVLIKSFINYYSMKDKTQIYNRKDN